MSEIWNRCDACGRFIGLAEFMDGRAHRELVTPDTAFTVETYETLHTACDIHSGNHQEGHSKALTGSGRAEPGVDEKNP